MSAPELTEIRALLAQFRDSGLRDLWVRSSDWSVFLAKPGGAIRPGIGAADVGQAAASPPEQVVSAPHLGIVSALLAPTTKVVAGTRIAELAVLDERRPVYADRSGTVSALLTSDGALVEFGAPLMRIA